MATFARKLSARMIGWSRALEAFSPTSMAKNALHQLGVDTLLLGASTHRPVERHQKSLYRCMILS